jgi:N-acetylmuramoyl-L-alanine amidase
MKRTLKISVIVALLVACIFMATAVLAQTVVYTAVIDTGALNVRQGPGINYASTTTVYKGQTVTLLGRNDNSSWAKIRTIGGQEGWVNASYIIPNNVAISSLPIMSSSAMPLPTPLAPVTPGGIAVRSGPGFNFPAAGFVNNGSFVNLLGRNGDATWVKVSANNDTLVGWMNASVLQTNLPIHNLPVVDGSTVTPTPIPTPPTTPPPSGASAIITTGSLNVRSGPGVGYNVLGQVHLGQVVTLLGRNSESTWVKIPIYGGVSEGWISAAYIQANVAISTLPVIGTPTLSSVGVLNTGAANVRQGPGLEYTSITTVGFGTTVTLIGRNSASNWLKVQLASGTQGWIHASLLTINVAVNTLPVVG